MSAQIRPADAAAPEPVHPLVRAAADEKRTVPRAQFDALADAATQTSGTAADAAAAGVGPEADDDRTLPLAPQIALLPPTAPVPSISFDAVRLRQLHRGAPYTLLLSVFSCVVAATVLAGRTAWPVRCCCKAAYGYCCLLRHRSIPHPNAHRYSCSPLPPPSLQPSSSPPACATFSRWCR